MMREKHMRMAITQHIVKKLFVVQEYFEGQIFI